MYKIDINNISNGIGKKAYGNKIEAYSFIDITSDEWFNIISNELIESVGVKYLPIYRIADGELIFLFGQQFNFKNFKIKLLLKYLIDRYLRKSFKTTWGEEYKRNEKKILLRKLFDYLKYIASYGKLAIYWNENGLNAYTEYNQKINKLFNNNGIKLSNDNYIPFHFVQALITNNISKLFNNRIVLFVSSIDHNEFCNLEKNMIEFGAKRVILHYCSKTNALNDDYSKNIISEKIDIVLVAAGIGAANALVNLRYLNCPIVDIGGFIHVLSGNSESSHGGFFVFPKLSKSHEKFSN